MTDRLEIASRVLAWMVHEHNSPDVAARESLYFADALLAAHEATAPKAEALPEDDECWGCRRESAPIIIGDERFCVVCAASEIINLRAAKQRYIDAMPPRLPDDAPVMEWEVTIYERPCKGEFWRGKPETMRYFAAVESGGDYVRAEGGWDRAVAAADLPALKAAATAYSAAKGYRAVFVEEGCKDA